VLDGEIVCLAPDGTSQFYDLMFRREWPHFMAFDLLGLNGNDLRGLPLRKRKQRLARIMPKARVHSRLRLVEHIEGAGVNFFKAACKHDLEGIVAKWADGTYRDGGRTSWLKIRNAKYSHWDGRRELFEKRRNPDPRESLRPAKLALE
jgi:bifunctional non-homologous end joining protein LigD